MSLFFDVLSSINNPNQQGSVTQLGNVVGGLQQLATSQGIDAAQMQSVLSSVGGFLGPALQQQQGMLGGGGQLENLVGQLGGSGAPATAMQSLIPPQVMQQLVQVVSQKTGLDAGMLQGLLPSLIPAVMGLLNMGSSQPGTRGDNPLLGAFLSGGSNADLGEVFKFANRFLNPPQ